MYSIAAEELADWTNRIAILLNSIYGGSTYSKEDVEIIIAIRDFNNGQGNVMSSRAVVVNPIDHLDDFVVDCIGPPQEALEKLEEALLAVKQDGSIRRMKASFNRTKLN